MSIRERLPKPLGRIVDAAVARTGSAYLVGPELGDALPVARRLTAASYRVSLGYWNAATDDPETVTTVTAAAARAVRLGEDPTIAVKASAMAFSPALIDRVAEDAGRSSTSLTFDALHPEAADATLSLALRTQRATTRTGIALPARWRRSLRDADVAAEAGLRVRLVKGQFPDPSGEDRSLTRGFLALVDRLAGLAVPIAVATHDAALLEAALDHLCSEGTPCEVELLLGLPLGKLLDIAARYRVPVRVYVAFGHPSIAYPLSSVLKRPRLTRAFATGLLSANRNSERWLRAALESNHRPDHRPTTTDDGISTGN